MDRDALKQLLAKLKNPERTDTQALRATIAVIVFNTMIAGILCCYKIPYHYRMIVDDLSQSIGPFAAAIWCFCKLPQFACRSAVKGFAAAKPLLSPLFLSLGAICFAIGMLIWSYSEICLHVVDPFPSWADAFYLTAYPFLFAGVLSIPAKPLSLYMKMVLLIEGLLITTGIGTFSWYFVIGPTVFQTGETLLARVLGAAYPVADIGLICSMLMVFARCGKNKTSFSGSMLAFGLLAVCCSDTSFDYLTLKNTYVTGHIIDIGWTFGYMMIALSGRYGIKKSSIAHDDIGEDGVERISSASPEMESLSDVRPVIGQAVVVIAVASLQWYSLLTHVDARLQIGISVGADLIVVALLVRQLLMVFENKELTRKLMAFSENLEYVVEQRTLELGAKSDQLIALQTLTTAINETLDTQKVISAASINSRAVFNADAVAIWLCDGASTDINQIPQGCSGLSEGSRALGVAAVCAVENTSTIQRISVDAGDPDEIYYEYLQAPLRTHGILIGKLGILRKSGEFSRTEKQLVDSIALHIATSLNNAKQYWHARDAADRDPVTNLINHRAIHEYLDIALELQSYSEEPLAVILADIDNFHMFNDTYGHPIGDDVLRKVATILDKAVTIPCKVGRYRGDEFILVLPGFTSEQSVVFAHSLQAEIAQLELKYSEDDRTIPTSVSFGIASFPEDSKDRQDLLTTANTNLTSAKNSDAHIVALSEMQRAHRELRVSSSFRMLDGMVTAVDNKDSYTRLHSEDVTEFALWIADELDLDNEVKQMLRTGGLLHDVGKIGVPDEILRKPGRLDEEEYNVMKQHPTLGALIVGGVAGMDNIVDIVKYHHERWDGQGYPEALAAENIPFNARLVAVADAMSAMTTDRPYRKGMSVKVAMQRIREGKGTQFDPQIADAFLRIAESKLSKRGDSAEAQADLPKAA